MPTRFRFVLAMLGGIAVAGHAGAQTSGPPSADLKPLVPGTTWTVRSDSGDGSPKTSTWTVLPGGVYEGRAVHRATDGTTTIVIDKESRNTIARLKGDQPSFSMKPHEGKFTWPLTVGRTWTTSFEATDYGRGRSFADVASRWKVVEYEDVSVPAGTFKAFRIQSTPARNQSVTWTTWYAPEPGLVVKEIIERAGRNYLGAGKTTVELVEYKLP